ncbi:hypothetical protein [Chryseobacterium sp. JUb7]|uniref:hypothetical protein n=1 Tax=Chryseobacterium sp. JUb7 TaxID=2940599 RepID=UPI00216A6215|nr:hypothetical protein [Chryseobacterium sp. JUb7]MCS3530737.1 hypothetical protein [Chryseobacterium sp. JUb7]
MKNLFILLTVPVMVFCNFLQTKLLNNNDVGKETFHLKGSDKIVYLFFKVEKNTSNTEKIILEDKKMVSGKLKSNPVFDEEELKVGDFVISLTDTRGKEVVKQIVEDPLNPVMEVYEDTISRNKVSLQNAEFSIRYVHSENIQMVKIEKVTNTGRQLLFTQKL